MKTIYAILIISFLFQFNTNAQWEQQTAPSLNDNLNSVYFIRNLIGYAVGEHGRILTTSNAGGYWLVQNSPTTNDLNSIYFIEFMGWAVGTEGTIIKTTDGGNNWNIIYSGISTDLRDVFFIDVNNGWAVGDDGIIFRTTNGGNN